MVNGWHNDILGLHLSHMCSIFMYIKTSIKNAMNRELRTNNAESFETYLKIYSFKKQNKTRISESA